MILNIVITIFIILETSNVIILYFFPSFKYGNGVSAFNEFELSKKDEARHLFAKYMTNWVAGTKLIFILLLVVILLTASDLTKIYSIIVMIISISTYYLKLAPIITKLDKLNKITPKGYSRTLTLMISGFITFFVLSLVIYFLF